MTSLLSALLVGLSAAFLAGGAVLLLRLATPGGAVTLAIEVGVIAGFGSWPWGVVALTFVACLCAAGHYRRADKAALADTLRRTQRLDWVGAIGRLGWAVVLAIVFDGTPASSGYLGFVGAVAASAADVVATQLGVLSAQKPRSITTWRPVSAGTPGAVSLLGTIAIVGASYLVGLVGLASLSLQSWLAQISLPRVWSWLPVAALAGGMSGAMLDSLLAATAQRVYYDPRRQEPSEFEVDATGTPNDPVRGWAWLSSEAIDLVATALGAAVTLTLAAWLARSLGHW